LNYPWEIKNGRRQVGIQNPSHDRHIICRKLNTLAGNRRQPVAGSRWLIGKTQMEEEQECSIEGGICFELKLKSKQIQSGVGGER
jgi:hypothetical protein